MGKYTIDDGDISVLSIREVAEQMMNSRLEDDERIGDVRLECGIDLEVDVYGVDNLLDRTDTFTIGDIIEEFTFCNAYAWAKDENGADVLLGFL